ncbi:cytochrome c oxidase subunit 1, partial [Coelomomyces lativittatus]
MSIQSLSDIDALLQKYRSLVEKESEYLTEPLPLKVPNQIIEEKLIPESSISRKKSGFVTSNEPSTLGPVYVSNSPQISPKLQLEFDQRTFKPENDPNENKLAFPVRHVVEKEFVLSTKIQSSGVLPFLTRRRLRTDKLRQRNKHQYPKSEQAINYFKPMKPSNLQKKFEPDALGMSISQYLMHCSESYAATSFGFKGLQDSDSLLNTLSLEVAKINLRRLSCDSKWTHLNNQRPIRLKRNLSSERSLFLISPLNLELPTSLSPQCIFEFIKKYASLSYRPPNSDPTSFIFTHYNSQKLSHSQRQIDEEPPKVDERTDLSDIPPSLSISPVKFSKERPILPIYLSLCPSRFMLHEPTVEPPPYSSTDSLCGSHPSLFQDESDNDEFSNSNMYKGSEDELLDEFLGLDTVKENLLRPSDTSESMKLDNRSKNSNLEESTVTSHSDSQRSSRRASNILNLAKAGHSKIVDPSQKSTATGFGLNAAVQVEQSTKPSIFSSITAVGMNSLKKKKAFHTHRSPSSSKQNLKHNLLNSSSIVVDSLEGTESSMNYNTIVDNSEEEYTDGQAFSLEYIYEEVLAWPGHFEINPIPTLEFDDLFDLSINHPSIQKVEWMLLSDPALPHADTAMDILEILQTSPIFPKFVYYFWLAKSGNLDDAFVRLSLDDPTSYSLPMHFVAAQIRILSNRLEDALKDLDEILSRDRNQLIVWSLKARLHEILGPPKSLINAYTHVIRAKPKLWRYYFERGCTFESIDEGLYAFEDFKLVRQLNPDILEPVWRHVYYYFDRQLYEDAQLTIQTILERQPNNPRALFFRGKGYAQLQNFSKAIEDFSSAIRLDPYSAEYYIHRGCLLRDSHPQKAIEDLSVALLLNDSVETSDALLIRGYIYQKMELFELTLCD